MAARKRCAARATLTNRFLHTGLPFERQSASAEYHPVEVPKRRTGRRTYKFLVSGFFVLRVLDEVFWNYDDKREQTSEENVRL